jgi:hypothetical protein
MLQRTLSAGFVAPCLPSKTDKLPSGSDWLHEIIARKNGAQVRLYSRPGNDLTYRFPLIVETLARLRSRSCCTTRHSNSIRTAPAPTARGQGRVVISFNNRVYSGALPSDLVDARRRRDAGATPYAVWQASPAA